MPKPRKPDRDQLSLVDVDLYLKTAPCVPVLRAKVAEWRDKQYPGATDVTRELLNWWFATDHQLPDGRRFAYHESQRDAVETLIYCYEVAQVRTRQGLLQRFAQDLPEMHLPPEDGFARYCTKMATGSGKTKVMALAVAWHYWNAVMGGNATDYARTFLVIAPNIIVLERLKLDFAGGHIFASDPVMPPHLKYLWDLECVVRGEGERAHSEGALYLTNIHQLYDHADRANGHESDPLAAVLGPKPPADQGAPPDFLDRIAARGGPLVVLNDEAHHTHEEDSEWNVAVRRLHAVAPLAAQLDFSATPRFTKGQLFPWVISDYPLKQAIVDGVVKRPYKGVASINEVASDHASIKYQGYLVAAVERWREYRDQLAPTGKKPLLFVMLTTTDDADDVGDWLRTKYPDEFAGDRTLIIHTRGDGDIKEKDLDAARRAARDVDADASPVNAIVSVLMLREGWDVQNVTVIVGLRPYSAKANILPEQTIGRGLRLMFRGTGVSYDERVDIIGNQGFLQFVDDLERYEHVDVGEFELGQDALRILTIQPVAEKAAFDIAIPRLSPALQRKRSLQAEIDALDVLALPCPPLPLREGDQAEQTFRYEGMDIITLKKEFEREYVIPPVKTAGEIVGFYARIIAQHLKLPAQFAHLAPKVQEFFARKAFGRVVDLDDEAVIRAMSRSQVGYVVVNVFGAALRGLLVDHLTPALVDEPRRLAAIVPFPFSNPHAVAGRKCILNYAPCTNDFERDFGAWLDAAGDVRAWCKLPEKFGVAIEYIDPASNLRYYYPDFVAVAADRVHWLLETKGAETVEVAAKDAAAALWCANATELTGTTWRYKKVPQTDFARMQPADFADLSLLDVWR